MKLEQQLIDPIRDHLIEVVGIGSLVLFGVLMVFFGWLKYKNRNNSAGMKPEKRPRRKANQK